MEDNFKDYFAATRQLLQRYVEARWRLTKLSLAGKISRAMGLFFSITLMLLLSFFVVLFLGFVLAYWISGMVESVTLGFTITAAVFIVLLLIVLFFRKPLIQRPLAKILIRELAEEVEDDDEDDDGEGHLGI
ncbi:phage holin family protein [Compostibacter hankyongensis]|uniref:Phage holin family protein n=1 Tax=Compostibacter hankyongensis TaxID=1007089 RepID=A0ABP8FCJ3_9BACT